MFTMPGDNLDIQEVAKYLQIDTNGGDPILCATMGRGQLVHRSPLYAKPRKTPQLTLTKQELLFFQGGESYTTMVNSALTIEDDIGLQVEVYCYQAGLKRECNMARELATLKYKYQWQ